MGHSRIHHRKQSTHRVRATKDDNVVKRHPRVHRPSTTLVRFAKFQGELKRAIALVTGKALWRALRDLELYKAITQSLKGTSTDSGKV